MGRNTSTFKQSERELGGLCSRYGTKRGDVKGFRRGRERRWRRFRGECAMVIALHGGVKVGVNWFRGGRESEGRQLERRGRLHPPLSLGLRPRAWGSKSRFRVLVFGCGLRFWMSLDEENHR